MPKCSIHSVAVSIVDGRAHGCNGFGGDVELSDFAIHRGIEHHIAALGLLGVEATNQGNAGKTAAAEIGQDREQLSCLGGVGEQQGHVVGINDLHVSMQGVHLVEEDGREPNRKSWPRFCGT
jgi:hypothetical protein